MLKANNNTQKTVMLCLILPVLLVTLLYAGGFISQFIINYTTWTSAGGTPGNGTSPNFPSSSLKACFTALTVWGCRIND